MIVSTKGRYALRVMVGLALREEGEYVPLKEIAESEGISQKYLESIMTTLSKGDLVDALHGKGGGYRLNKPARDYTVGSILKLTEGFALNVLGFVKKKFTEGIKSKMGAILLLDKVKEIKGAFDYSNYGGAPILGVKGPVVKIHGSSNANAVKHGILKAIPFAEGKVVQIVEEAVLALEEAESGE